MSRSLRIDVFFDFICPWCLIGKRQLERALAQLRASRPEVEVELAWHGVQLLPHIPVQGEPFAEFYRDRLGSAEAVRLRQAQVQQAAAAAGLELELARIASMPNTADAHRLLQRAGALAEPAQRDALLERLFAAYFHKGEDLGDRATLLAIAESCGFQPAQLAPALRGDGRPYVAAQPGGLAQSVPYFVFNNRLALSGAQPAEVLHAAMLQALSQNLEQRA
ncbi:DsbA family oxidoreductase [Pseudomonas cavernicola]|uniref:DsbA family oxidoreductase n=1 Tax=Pseudomonas cavernicola TaxID=2320866 RepID=A0A418X908_9PSED|nr:DsbA family oxidoreductase [Pseudomonas cavernicola]RJG08969.1 DsbA family oxidoreductase [Pseudomonas cavernicola]